MEGLNGCGRALRGELTKLWHQCIATVAMPIIADKSLTDAVPLKLAALTAVSTMWEDHDLAFLHECGLWSHLQNSTMACNARNATLDNGAPGIESAGEMQDVLWALLAQLSLTTFCNKVQPLLVCPLPAFAQSHRLIGRTIIVTVIMCQSNYVSLSLCILSVSLCGSGIECANGSLAKVCL